MNDSVGQVVEAIDSLARTERKESCRIVIRPYIKSIRAVEGHPGGCIFQIIFRIEEQGSDTKRHARIKKIPLLTVFFLILLYGSISILKF